MDATDLRIFTGLVSDAFASDADLARQVGLTGKAVRLRRRRLEARGVITAYGVYPSPALLGRHALSWLHVGREGSDVPVSKLLEVDDLAYVMAFRPALHRVVRFATDPDAGADPRLVRMLGPPLGGREGEPVASPRTRRRPLSKTDWRVLESIVRSPRASFSAKARSAGLSPRTVRIHQTRLGAEHAFGSAMILDLERETGVSTFGIWLKTDASFDARSVEHLRLWDRPHWTRRPRGVYLLGSAGTYFAARQAELELRSLPGVLEANPLIPAGGYFARDRLLSWMRHARDRVGR